MVKDQARHEGRLARAAIGEDQDVLEVLKLGDDRHDEDQLDLPHDHGDVHMEDAPDFGGAVNGSRVEQLGGNGIQAGQIDEQVEAGHPREAVEGDAPQGDPHVPQPEPRPTAEADRLQQRVQDAHLRIVDEEPHQDEDNPGHHHGDDEEHAPEVSDPLVLEAENHLGGQQRHRQRDDHPEGREFEHIGDRDGERAIDGEHLPEILKPDELGVDAIPTVEAVDEGRSDRVVGENDQEGECWQQEQIHGAILLEEEEHPPLSGAAHDCPLRDGNLQTTHVRLLVNSFDNDLAGSL